LPVSRPDREGERAHGQRDQAEKGDDFQRLHIHEHDHTNDNRDQRGDRRSCRGNIEDGLAVPFRSMEPASATIAQRQNEAQNPELSCQEKPRHAQHHKKNKTHAHGKTTHPDQKDRRRIGGPVSHADTLIGLWFRPLFRGENQVR